ncbi:hypothetical protein AA313_de0205310 [Arthrobotrys entomopaga]|nr:hypothetical protein AA313_de0205310 [Arthrobotrys entomopaga]
MHIGIRNQLSAFVLLVSLTSLGVLAIVTWFNNQSLVTDLRRSRLALIANLKSEQIASDINLLQSAVTNVASRAQVLNAIKRYTGEIGGVKNHTYENWNASLIDVSLVLSTQLALQHVTVFSSDFKTVYLNVTSQGVVSENTPGLVPIGDATGNTVGFNSILGHPGFPNELFPKSPPPDDGTLLLGPVRSLTNSSAQIASITTPIYNNTTAAVVDKSILGYVTVVCSLFSVENNLNDYADLGETYKYFLLGPANGNMEDESSGWPGNVSWRYVLPPIISTAGQGTLGGFWSKIGSTPGFMGSLIDTRNPANRDRVAIGFSPVDYSLVSWILVVQMDYSEVNQPISHLRNLLLATVFGTAAGVVIVTCVLATYAIRPIARLRDATEKTTRPPGYSPTAYDSETEDPPAVFGAAAESTVDESLRRRPWWKRGFTAEKFEDRNARGRKERSFRVPEKVPDKKHLITDELTDLTRTFNEMTDELVKQYSHLEERVATRTAELKEQTQLANAANDAKSMFIANVTHELRTPLNGILGMCSVMLTEPNLAPGIKRSLNTIYKSGDLLLCLLTDLLTFSRNQVAGVNVVLEEGEFFTRDLVSQVRAIFVKTARDKGVELGVEIVNDNGNPESGEPSINGVLRGDLNRVLQVVINLLSNALKFTPEKGSVQLRIAMLKDTKGVALTTEDTPQKDMPTLKMPQTAMINPNTPANMALKAKREATSLTIPSLTTPGEISNSSTTEAYFGSSVGHREGEEGSESEGGRTPAEDPRIRIRWFEFSVIDTGPGIPSHMHTKIFEPFVQGDLGLSKKYGGTGLGLSICKQLAELMGGVIELKSFEGAGSTFTLRIPLKAGGFATQPPLGYSRPGSLATTRYTRNLPPNLRPRGDIDNASTKTASTAFSSISGGGQADATRLVGLSQPFFAPEVPPDDENFTAERRPSRAHEKQSAGQRHSKVEHSPPPQISTIPPYSELSPSGPDPTSTEIIISARRPALERTSSSPAMLTPRSNEGFVATVRKPSDDYGKATNVPLTVVGNGGAHSPTAQSKPPGLLPTPSTAESAAPRTPAPVVTISPSKSVKIGKAVSKQPETAGESSTTAKKDKRTNKDMKELKDKRASIKVLVAEDNRVNIQVIKKMLRLEAVSDVTLAEDGAIAVDKVKEALAIGKKFDIILMDIQMPNMDGLQATKAIREMGYTSAICALTAFAEQSNVKECFDAGMDYFLAKPIKKNELRKVLQLYGSSSSLTDPEPGAPSSSAAAAGPSESA